MARKNKRYAGPAVSAEGAGNTVWAELSATGEKGTVDMWEDEPHWGPALQEMYQRDHFSMFFIMTLAILSNIHCLVLINCIIAFIACDSTVWSMWSHLCLDETFYLFLFFLWMGGGLRNCSKLTFWTFQVVSYSWEERTKNQVYH